MKPIRDAMPPNHTWSELTQACHKQFIDLRATSQNKENDLQMYPVYGLAAADMEVDILTGMYQLRRVDIVEDVGESLSPNVDVGQIEGGFVMGMGYWLSEKLIYSRVTGELLTDRSWTYKPPGALDIPIDFRITFLRKSPIPNAGVLGAKGKSIVWVFVVNFDSMFDIQLLENQPLVWQWLLYLPYEMHCIRHERMQD